MLSVYVSSCWHRMGAPARAAVQAIVHSREQVAA